MTDQTDQTDQTEPNEIVAAAAAMKAQADAAAGALADKTRSWPIAKIGLGIGSAAVAAAVLFASRNAHRTGDK